MPRLPSSQNVPQISPEVTRDPGLNIPAQAFESTLSVVAGELAPAVNKLAEAAERTENRKSAVDRARWRISKREAGETELMRLNTEDDLSDETVLDRFGAFLEKNREEALQNHKGSEDSRALLDVNLREINSDLINKAAGLSATIGRQKVQKVFDDSLSRLSARAAENPIQIDSSYLDLEREITNMAGALSPTEEEKLRTVGREQITLSAIESSLTRGRIETAAGLMDQFGHTLSQDSQRAARRKIEDMRATVSEVTRKVVQAEAVLGRPLNNDERIRLLGLEPKTPLVSIQNTGEGARAKAEGEAVAKITTEQLPQVRKQIGQLTAMERMLQGGLETGGLVQLRLQAANFFGVSPQALGAGSDLAAFRAVANSAVLTKSAELKGAISDRDITFVQNAVASAGASPESNRAVLSIQKKLLERERDSLQLMDRYHTAKGTLSGFGDYLARWAEENPLFWGQEAQDLQARLPGKASGQVPTIESQKAYDALPPGTRYMSGGKEYIKGGQ